MASPHPERGFSQHILAFQGFSNEGPHVPAWLFCFSFRNLILLQKRTAIAVEKDEPMLMKRRKDENALRSEHRGLQYYDANYYRMRRYEDLDPYLKHVLLKDIIGENTSGRPRARILDVGCGLGVYVSFLRASGFESYGVDVSLQAAKLSRQVRASATFLPFRADLMDVIVSAHLIEHLKIEDVATFFAEAHRVLKRSGKLFVITPNAWSVVRPFYGKKWCYDPTHVSLFSPNTLKEALERCGYSNVVLACSIPLLLQHRKRPKWIMRLGRLERILRALPWVQDVLFWLIGRAPLSYFRNVIFLCATANKWENTTLQFCGGKKDA